MTNFSDDEKAAIPLVLSAPRFATYLAYTRNDVLQAMRLYQWNAEVSAAFLFPLHVFEVCVRNAAANAIESFYNQRWPWTTAFEMSLPDPARPRFSPRRELAMVRAPLTTAGKVIADIKFAFWVSMYTARHEGRLWQRYLRREYPHLPPRTSVYDGREKIYKASDQVRNLRNRIAHHEPIFTRNLANDYAAMTEIIGLKCPTTQGWVNRVQGVTGLLTSRPVP